MEKDLQVQAIMQQKTMTTGEAMHLQPRKNEDLRRVCSDVLPVTDDIVKDISKRDDDVEKAECECCGMYEDCTPTYITRIRAIFCGKWICGLCAEAVNEKMKRNPELPIESALESQMSLCKQFNRTIRINPKLSLAGNMRDIARMSSQRRRTSEDVGATKISRTVSCDPTVKSRRSSFQ